MISGAVSGTGRCHCQHERHASCKKDSPYGYKAYEFVAQAHAVTTTVTTTTAATTTKTTSTTTTTTTLAVFGCEAQWPIRQWEERWGTYCAGTGDDVAWAMTKDCAVAWPGTADTAMDECRELSPECVMFDTNRGKCGRKRAPTTAITTTVTNATTNATTTSGAPDGAATRASVNGNGTAGAAGPSSSAGPAVDTSPLGLNTTQLFLSLDVDGDGVVTYTDVTDYCAAQDCRAAELVGALGLELDTSTSGVDMAVFVASIDADTIGAAGRDTMATIVVAAADDGNASQGGGRGRAAATVAEAMERCMRSGEQWLPCATTNECYKKKNRCDGGAPDCADGSDEAPALCNTTPSPSGAANATAASRGGEDAASDGEFGVGTMIAIIGIALVVAAGVVVVCCCQCRKGKSGEGKSSIKYEPSSANSQAARTVLARMNGDQVQGLSMSFGNPAFNGKLHTANKVPQASYESIQYSDKATGEGGASHLNIAATLPGQSAAGSSGMDVAVPSYDAIDDVKSAGADMVISVPNYAAIDDANGGDATYDVATNGLFAGGPGQQDYDHDFPMQGTYGQMEDPPRRVYNLEDPTKAGTVRTYDLEDPTKAGTVRPYDLEDPTKAGHGAQNYDLGHTDASGNARVGHSSHYGNTVDGYFAAVPPQHTSYDHDDNSMSEEEI